MITLKKADINDCEKVYRIKLLGFKALLDKYQDFETSPGAETFERVKEGFGIKWAAHYFIDLNGESIGYIRIYKKSEDRCRLSQMLILPEYQGKGYAQQAIRQAEELNPQAQHWELDTIKQEEKLCHLYEKMGYRQTGTCIHVKDGMDLVDYEKTLENNVRGSGSVDCRT